MRSSHDRSFPGDSQIGLAGPLGEIGETSEFRAVSSTYGRFTQTKSAKQYLRRRQLVHATGCTWRTVTTLDPLHIDPGRRRPQQVLQTGVDPRLGHLTAEAFCGDLAAGGLTTLGRKTCTQFDSSRTGVKCASSAALTNTYRMDGVTNPPHRCLDPDASSPACDTLAHVIDQFAPEELGAQRVAAVYAR